MLSGIVGASAYGLPGASGTSAAVPGKESTAALNGEIRRDQVQLNDWVTCVSAKTPKGRAQIQSLSAQISAARERISTIEAEKGDTRASASGAARRGGLVDTWA